MLPSELIERLKREREERDRPAAQLPLYPPQDSISSENHDLDDQEEYTGRDHVIVIDLA